MPSIINPEVDDLEPAQALLKRKLGRRVSPGTLWRWHKKGCRGIRLECLRVGGILQTTAAAVTAFIVGQNRDENSAEVPGSPEERQTKVRSPSTARRLRDAGILE